MDVYVNKSAYNRRLPHIPPCPPAWREGRRSCMWWRWRRKRNRARGLC